jgi:hypothetical protein
VFYADELSLYYQSLGAVHLLEIERVREALGDGISFFRNVVDLEVFRAIYGIKLNNGGLDGVSIRFLKLSLPLILPCTTLCFDEFEFFSRMEGVEDHSCGKKE